MADIEQSLKEAVASAQRIGRLHPVALRPMTAAEVVGAIEAVAARLREVQDQSFELAGLLVGSDDAPPPDPVSEPAPGHTIFDRMGRELLVLTRAIEAIERELQRSLTVIRL
jgi:hypothetical protein